MCLIYQMYHKLYKSCAPRYKERDIDLILQFSYVYDITNNGYNNMDITIFFFLTHSECEFNARIYRNIDKKCEKNKI